MRELLVRLQTAAADLIEDLEYVHAGGDDMDTNLIGALAFECDTAWREIRKITEDTIATIRFAENEEN